MSSLDCRMFEDEYPSEGALVVVEVKSVASHGVYCALLEYNQMEGLILTSELSRRRIRSMANVIAVGKQEVVQILKVDRVKGYIDLSKKRVEASEVSRIEERWNNSKAVHSILRHAVRSCGSRHSLSPPTAVSPLAPPTPAYNVESLYRKFVWPLARQFKHAYDGLKDANSTAEKWQQFCSRFDIADDLAAVLRRELQKRFKPQMVHISQMIQVTCFSMEGIVAIRTALGKALTQHNTADEMVAKITLIRPPHYKIALTTAKPKQREGEDKIKAMIATISQTMDEFKGFTAVKLDPVITDSQSRKKGAKALRLTPKLASVLPPLICSDSSADSPLPLS